MSEKEMGFYEKILKMDLRIEKIVKKEPIPQSRNLIKLSIHVDKGELPLEMGSQTK